MKDRIVNALLILTVMMFSIAGSAAQAGEITLSYVNSYLWNNIRDMEICGHLLYCGYGNGLKILDVSTPSKPRTISTTPIKGGTVDIYLQGTYAWLATEHNGIEVIDTSSARNPRIVTSIDEKASSMAGKQGFLFCTCGKSGLKVYTVGNPGSPELVDTYNPNGFSIDMVRVKGNQAFVLLAEGEKPHTLALIDISDPHDIREISRCAIVSDGSLQSIDFGIVDLAVKDDTVFLVDRTKGVLAVDVSDPHFPVKLPYVPLLEESLAYKLTIAGNCLIVMHTSGLSILDISQSGRPCLISRQQGTGGASLCAKDGFIYQSSKWDGGGLTVLDMHDCSNIREVGYLKAPSDIKQVFVRDGFAYVTHDFGFTVLDVHDPGNARIVEEYQSSGYVIDMYVYGNYAYLVTMEKGLEIADIRVPRICSYAGGYNEENTFIDHVIVVGTMCYLTSRECIPKPDGTLDYGASYLYVLDIREPINPVKKSSNRVPCSFTSLAAKDDLLFAHCPFEGIFSFTTSPDMKLHSAGKLYRSHKDICGFGSDERMAFYKNYLLVAHGDCGLTIVDTTDPSYMYLRKVIKNQDYMIDVFACDGRAFIAETDRGLEIIDISDMDHIKTIGRYQTSGCATGVCVYGDYVYVADGYSLTVLKRK